MRCGKCGSKSINFENQHQLFSGKKAVVGALAVGPVGALAGFTGKDQEICRCHACGAVNNRMDSWTEQNVDKAIELVLKGKDTSSYIQYKSRYFNLETVTALVQESPVQENISIQNDQLATTSSIANRQSETKHDFVENKDNLIETEPVKVIKNNYFNREWNPDCPVFLESYAILAGTDSDYAIIRLKNLSDHTIRSVYLETSVRDDADDELSKQQFVLQNVETNPGLNLPSDQELRLNTTIAYSIQVRCIKVTFIDAEVWRADDNNTIIELPAREELEGSEFPGLKYITKAFQYGGYRFDETDLKFFPKETDNLWTCICGSPVKRGCNCPHCGISLEQLHDILTAENLESVRNQIMIDRAEATYKITGPFLEKALQKLISQAQCLANEKNIRKLLIC